MFRKRRRLWPGLAGVGAVLLLLFIVRYLSEAIPKHLPVAEALVRQASSGVPRNADWKPVIRRLQGLYMALVPTGCFEMGLRSHEFAEALESCERYYGAGKCQIDFREIEQPSRKVCFDRPFWIGLTEVNNLQYGGSSSTGLTGMYRGPFWPRETVNWAEAGAFCRQRGMRLPTEAEWEYAARGPESWVYPWSDTFNPEILTWHSLFPTNVGAFPEGASWVGALDLSGGVMEWVQDWYGVYGSGAGSGAPGPEAGGERVVRGGSWFSYASFFFVRASQREAYDPEYATSVLGFRCAADFDR